MEAIIKANGWYTKYRFLLCIYLFFFFFLVFMIVGSSVAMAKFIPFVGVRSILSTDNTVFHGIANPRHTENAHTNNPCPIKFLWAFSPRRGLASPWVTVPYYGDGCAIVGMGAGESSYHALNDELYKSEAYNQCTGIKQTNPQHQVQKAQVLAVMNMKMGPLQLLRR